MSRKLLSKNFHSYILNLSLSMSSVVCLLLHGAFIRKRCLLRVCWTCEPFLTKHHFSVIESAKIHASAVRPWAMHYFSLIFFHSLYQGVQSKTWDFIFPSIKYISSILWATLTSTDLSRAKLIDKSNLSFDFFAQLLLKSINFIAWY